MQLRCCYGWCPAACKELGFSSNARTRATKEVVNIGDSDIGVSVDSDGSVDAGGMGIGNDSDGSWKKDEDGSGGGTEQR